MATRRPSGQDSARLAIELLRRIPRTRKVTASELRDQLAEAGIDRDLRSVQRQLDMLSTHFDIERDDSSKPYGYRWKAQAAGLSLAVMSEHEALLLALAEQHLRHLLPASVLKSMDGFFEQARRNLSPTRDAKREREWLDKVRVVSTTQPLLPPAIRPGVLEEVSNALYGNRWLNVVYLNAQGKRSKSSVMPLGLAQQGTSLYLVCRYPDYADERNLALHRMQSASASTLTFERPKDFNLARFDADGRFHFGDGQRIRLTFTIDKTAGHHLLESRLSEDQTVTEFKHTYRISATVVDSIWLWSWLRGFGESVKTIRKLIPSGMKAPQETH
jgi:predicted DNA-binding transcriptional regulator YafY